MKKITCYRTRSGALAALDNGGRFYHLFSKSGDGVVSGGELKKATGSLTGLPGALLHLDMALRDLHADDQRAVHRTLAPDTLRHLDNKGPTTLAPGAFDSDARTGHTYVVEGWSTPAGNRLQTSIVMVPIMTGKIMTMMSVPMSQAYSALEIRSKRESTTTCLLLLDKGRQPPASERVRWGGVATELAFDGEASPRLCLVPLYYTPLD